MFAISAHTQRRYSEISKAQYDFAESIYLYKNTKIKDFKELPLTAKLANYVLTRTNVPIWSKRGMKNNNSLVEKVIDRFNIDSTPEVVEALSNIVNLVEKIEEKYKSILLLSMLSKGKKELEKMK